MFLVIIQFTPDQNILNSDLFKEIYEIYSWTIVFHGDITSIFPIYIYSIKN